MATPFKHTRPLDNQAGSSDGVTKRVVGSGPWATYRETGSLANGDFTINIHRFSSRAAARTNALQIQRALGGFVAVEHKGNEIGSVGPNGASWLANANRAGSNYATDDAYDQRSKSEARADAARTARDWAQASPRERREDEAAFLDALKDPALIAERVSWLIDGNYGRGQYLHAREVLRRPRMNRKAWLVQAIGEAEWRLPPDVTIRLWKRLTPAQQKALDRVMDAIVRAPIDEDS